MGWTKEEKAYGGANGNKISVVYEGDTSMLKLPTHANLSYSNSSISEHLGCHIFKCLFTEAYF